jgi:hypothetical protein
LKIAGLTPITPHSHSFRATLGRRVRIARRQTATIATDVDRHQSSRMAFIATMF